MGQNGTRTIGDLKPSPYNPRKIDPERLRMLGDSMGEFGDLSGIVFNRRTGRLIGGHQRIKHIPESATIDIEQRYEEPTQAGTVAEGFVEMAGERWVYREVDVDETREAAMNVAANKHGGEFEFGSLTELLSELDAGGFDMPLTGFTDEELEGLLVRDGAGGEDTADLTPPEEPKSKRGEIYELGPHRLVCGDAKDPAVIGRAIGQKNELASAVWTDPPYGVDYVGKTKDALTVENDQPGVADALLREVLASVTPFVIAGAPFYIAAPAGPAGTRFRVAIEAVGWRLHQVLVWCKGRMVLGHSDYHYQHEDVLYGWLPREGGRSGRGNHEGSLWFGDNSQTTVFHVDTPSANPDHPTPKPVELIEPMLRNSTKRGQVVLDPFAGSGSTLIAADMCGRVARLIELEPRYCDVIRRRYATYVGDESLMP